jgi:hypothetical protein
MEDSAMSYEIYLCGDCLGAAWFPYGEFQHIGTGWDCWKSSQEGDKGDTPMAEPGKEFEKPPATECVLRERLVAKAKQLYRKWVRHPDRVRLLPFLQKQISMQRADVICDFLRYLAVNRDRAVAVLMRELTETPEWTRLARRLIPVYAGKRGRKTGAPAPSKRQTGAPRQKV